MLFRPRLGIYSNNNKTVTYNPSNGYGYSYGTRVALRMGSGVIITNKHYSNTTSRHYRKLESLFEGLGLKIYRVPDSLDRPQDTILDHICSTKKTIKELEEALKRKRVDWSKNYTQSQINMYKSTLSFLENRHATACLEEIINSDNPLNEDKVV